MTKSTSESTPAPSGPSESRQTLTEEQQGNLANSEELFKERDIISPDDPLEIEPAAPVTPTTTDTVEESTTEQLDKFQLPNGQELDLEQMNHMMELANSMEILERQYPEYLAEVVAKIQGHNGQQPQTSSSEESETQVDKQMDERLDRMENLIHGLANHLALGEQTSQNGAPVGLKDAAQEIMKEVPGLSVEKAVEFARYKLGSQGSGGNEAPPLKPTEVSSGASKSEETLEDLFKNASEQIRSIKNSEQAADTAIKKAIEIETMRADSQ